MGLEAVGVGDVTDVQNEVHLTRLDKPRKKTMYR
jgi:hypothetical protein